MMAPIAAVLDQVMNDPATRAQNTPALGERRCRIGHQHQSPAAQHGIDRIALEIDVLGIKNAVLDIRQAEQRSLAACRFHHVFREIRGYQFPCRSNYFRRGQSSVAGAGSKLQNGLLRINDRAIGTSCQIGGSRPCSMPCSIRKPDWPAHLTMAAVERLRICQNRRVALSRASTSDASFPSNAAGTLWKSSC